MQKIFTIDSSFLPACFFHVAVHISDPHGHASDSNRRRHYPGISFRVASEESRDVQALGFAATKPM